MQNLKHKILIALTALTIIGEVASIILWTANPLIPSGQEIRFTLAVDFTIAVANAAVFAVLNLVALVLIIKRNKIGPIFLIVISIINRAISHPIFIGGVHLIFVTWTAALVILPILTTENYLNNANQTFEDCNWIFRYSFLVSFSSMIF